MHEIFTFSGVRCRLGADRNPELNLEDVARGLGFTQKAKSGNTVVRWERVEKYLLEFGILQEVGEEVFIPENIFYKLCFKAKNKAAKTFQSMLIDEVLPSVRGSSSKICTENTNLNNQLLIINEQEVLGKQFRIYGSLENPLFLAKDVADWIEYSISNTSKLVGLVDENEKVRKIVTTLGGNQESWLFTEDGLYEVLMQSRKPIAKQFKKEVKQILKTIRKHGAYLTPAKIEEVLLNPDTIIKLANDLKVEREKCLLLEAQIEHDKPKVVFAEAITHSRANAVMIGELSKILKTNGIDIGQNRFCKWLRDNNYLMSRGSSYNMPTQRAMELGLFIVNEQLVVNLDGTITDKFTTRITGKGQQYFVNKFLGKGKQNENQIEA